MKKTIVITSSVIVLLAIGIIGFFYLRFINLDTFKWEENGKIITFKDIKYKDIGAPPDDLELGKQIGKMAGESSFRIWEIKGEKREDYIVITGFMFPRIMYKNVAIDN